MRVYWRKVKRGENLILSDENDGHERGAWRVPRHQTGHRRVGEDF